MGNTIPPAVCMNGESKHRDHKRNRQFNHSLYLYEQKNFTHIHTPDEIKEVLESNNHRIVISLRAYVWWLTDWLSNIPVYSHILCMCIALCMVNKSAGFSSSHTILCIFLIGKEIVSLSIHKASQFVFSLQQNWTQIDIAFCTTTVYPPNTTIVCFRWKCFLLFFIPQIVCPFYQPTV